MEQDDTAKQPTALIVEHTTKFTEPGSDTTLRLTWNPRAELMDINTDGEITLNRAELVEVLTEVVELARR